MTGARDAELTVLRGSGQPHNKQLSGPNVSAAELRKPVLSTDQLRMRPERGGKQGACFLPDP